MLLRKFCGYLFCSSLVCSFISVIVVSFRSEPITPSVAIFSSFSHNSLSECIESCQKELTSFGNMPTISLFNSEDNVVKARKIARTLHKDPNVVMIITLGPIATKVMSQIETQKPIIYAVVPAGEALRFPKEQVNIYGVNDSVDTNQCCFAIHAVTNNANSLVYLQPHEPFPSSLQEEITNKLRASGIKVTELPISAANMSSRIQFIAENRPSAVFFPLSSLSEKIGTTLIKSILKENIPLITDDSSLVMEGACAACSVDYKLSGKQIACIVRYLLSKKNNEEHLNQISAEPILSKITFNEEIIRFLGLPFNVAPAHQFISFHSADNTGLVTLQIP
ncbi:ABC transporter substrate-binding protein [Chlamydia trachomatis]|uniref:ABC transporter substrate-binding protein n=1 Tax=Chlamydia trachomatis TaxID=813 RepID=UPI0009F87CB3|nr:ABC transporter substrate-binding protein [Chlamydia trachomatis]